MTIFGKSHSLAPWIYKLQLSLLIVTGIMVFLNLDKLTMITGGSLEYSNSETPDERLKIIQYEKLLEEVDEKKEKYFMVVAIPTMPGNSAKRAAIRSTWSNASRWANLKDTEEQFKRIKIMFILGDTKFETESEEFKKEMKEYNDMYIINGLTEGRIVLKYKVLWGLKRSLTFDYDFFIKTDDDIFVNLPLMIMSLMASSRARLYTGSCMHVYGGWGKYPRWLYCSGGGYILSRDVVEEIQRLPERVHHVQFRPEDAYTGWLVHCLDEFNDFKVKVFTQGLLKVGSYKCGPFTHIWFYHHVMYSNMEKFFQKIDKNNYELCP